MRKIKTPTNQIWKINRPEYDKWLQETLLQNVGQFIENTFDLQDASHGVLSEETGAIALGITNFNYEPDDGSLSFSVKKGTGFFRDGDILRLIRWENTSGIQRVIANYGSNGDPMPVKVYLTFSYSDSQDPQYSVPILPLGQGLSVTVRQDMIPRISLQLPGDAALTGVHVATINLTCNTVTGAPSFVSIDESVKNYVIFRATKSRFEDFHTRLASLNTKIGDISIIGNRPLVEHLDGLNEAQTGNANQLSILAQVMMGESQFVNTMLQEGLLSVRELNTAVTEMQDNVTALNTSMYDHHTILGADNYDISKGTIHERLTRLENYPDGVFHMQTEVDLRTFDFNFSDETDHYEAAYGVSPATASDTAANRVDAAAIEVYTNNHPGFLFQAVDLAYEERMTRSYVDTNGDLNVHLNTHHADELDWRLGLHEDDRIITKSLLSYNTANGAIAYSGKVVGYSFRGYIRGSNAYLTLETGGGATKTLINSSPLAAGYHSGTAVTFFGNDGKDFQTDIIIRAGRWVSNAWQDTDFNMVGNIVIYYYINQSSGGIVE